MNSRFLPFTFALFLAGAVFAETPQEKAQKVTVSMTLNDVPAGAAAHFVELLSGIKVHYQSPPGDRALLSLDFENATADAALKYIAGLARLELTYQGDGAHFSPRK